MRIAVRLIATVIGAAMYLVSLLAGAALFGNDTHEWRFWAIATVCAALFWHWTASADLVEPR